jgi:hypothetical protein
VGLMIAIVAPAWSLRLVRLRLIVDGAEVRDAAAGYSSAARDDRNHSRGFRKAERFLIRYATVTCLRNATRRGS